MYHAIQISLDREVAIKILPAELSNDKAFCESFEAEAKAMAKLNHPNLIGVYDFGEVEKMLFIVMEYVPGDSLHDACHGSALEPSEVIRLMSGISRGLNHAHKHGILHRDIKPANILLDAELQPKIGDFGLARSVDAHFQEGETIFGTPGYTAPEVVECPHSVDQKADIFSLGILLHELLTGQLPQTDPRPPSAILPCDPRFDAVVRKATNLNPNERYQHAEEIAEELEKIGNTAGPRILQTAAAGGHSPTIPQSFSTTTPSRSGSGLVITILVVAVVAGVFFIFRDNDSSSKPDPKPDADPVANIQPSPVIPDPEPKPLIREPDPVVADPVPTDPDPVASAPDPMVSEPEVEPEDPEPVLVEKPKFDVEGFFTHARSVMVKRCEPFVTRHEKALENNIGRVKIEGLRLMKENLQFKWHDASTREIERFVDECKDNGNRLEQKILGPLKVKKWFIALNEERFEKQSQIDRELERALIKQQKTYLYGLGLKVKELLKTDDPIAVDMIKAEIEKVNASADYFPSLVHGEKANPE